MGITFDPAENEANIVEHGGAPADFTGFDAEPVVLVDDRFDYGEVRYQASGQIGGKDFCLVFSIEADAVREISFRGAHDKEMRRHE